MSASLWIVFIGIQSCKLCVIDTDYLGILLQCIVWGVDSIAAVYIVDFIENKNIVFWCWFITNVLQTFLFEPIIKRSFHFHDPIFEKNDEKSQKKIVKRYFYITWGYYLLHVIHISFMFLVIFLSFPTPPAELNVAIAFTWIGSAISCLLMGFKQQKLNDEIVN